MAVSTECWVYGELMRDIVILLTYLLYNLRHDVLWVQTFMIVSRDKSIFRFSSSKAVYLLTPFNPIRRIAMYILTHPYPFRCQLNCRRSRFYLIHYSSFIFVYFQLSKRNQTSRRCNDSSYSVLSMFSLLLMKISYFNCLSWIEAV